MPEAMALVKADLGPDAIILHSKTTTGKLARSWACLPWK
jgi:hypothetical protein